MCGVADGYRWQRPRVVWTEFASVLLLCMRVLGHHVLSTHQPTHSFPLEAWMALLSLANQVSQALSSTCQWTPSAGVTE